MLLHYFDGLSVTPIADILQTTVTKVNRCVDKALEQGVQVALREEQRSGRPPEVTPEAKSRRDPDFEAKRADVLCVYQQVEYILENEELKPLCDVNLSSPGFFLWRFDLL